MTYKVAEYKEMMKMAVADWVTQDVNTIDTAIQDLYEVAQWNLCVPTMIRNYWDVLDQHDKAAVLNRITFDVINKVPMPEYWRNDDAAKNS